MLCESRGMRVKNCCLLLTLSLAGWGDASVSFNTGFANPRFSSLPHRLRPSRRPASPPPSAMAKSPYVGARAPLRAATCWSAGETERGVLTQSDVPSASYIDAGLVNGTLSITSSPRSTALGQTCLVGRSGRQYPTRRRPVGRHGSAGAGGRRGDGGDAQVGLTWTASAGASGYQVKRARRPVGHFRSSPRRPRHSLRRHESCERRYVFLCGVRSRLPRAKRRLCEVSATPVGSAAPIGRGRRIGPARHLPRALRRRYPRDDRDRRDGARRQAARKTALANALAKGGVVLVSIAVHPPAMTLSSQKTLRVWTSTRPWMGKGRSRWMGRGTTRLLYYSSPNFAGHEDHGHHPEHHPAELAQPTAR